MKINSRYITFQTEEDMETTLDEIVTELPKMTKETESWLDEEYYRIYVTYAYADVTNMQ